MFFKKNSNDKDLEENFIKKNKKFKIPNFFKDLCNLLLPIVIVFGIFFGICFSL